MATANTLVLDVEEMLYGMARIEHPAEDVVTLADASTTSMTIATTTGQFWKKGDFAEIIPATAGAVGEIVILASTPTSSPATVRRAQRQTTAAAASSLVARKNPLFPRVAIDRAITETINSDLYPYVHYTASRSLTFVDQNHIYPLTAGDFDILWMYQTYDDELVRIPPGWWSVTRHIDTSIEATGQAIRLFRVYDITEPVFYIARVRPLSTAISSIPDSIAEMIPWRVCARLLGGTRVVPHRADPARKSLPDAQVSTPTSDWRFFQQQFILMRDQERDRIRFDQRYDREKRFIRKPRRKW